MGLDVGILLAGITSLFGVVVAVAKIAWSERGARLQKAEALAEECQRERSGILTNLLDASESQKAGVAVLTRVVEEAMREMTLENARRYRRPRE